MEDGSMKKAALLPAVLLLAITVLSSACAGQKTGTTATQRIDGVVTGLTVPLNSPGSLTMQTAQGPQTVQLADNTTYSLDGKACSIDDLGKLITSGNTTYNCTVVVEACQPGITAQYMSLYTVQ